jgi:hypothetical protein
MNRAMSRFRRSYIASLATIVVCSVAAILRAAAYQGISGLGGVIPILIFLAIALIPIIPEGGIACHPKSATGVAFFFVFAFGSGLLVGLVEVGLIGHSQNRSVGHPGLMAILPIVVIFLIFFLWLITAVLGLWALLKNPKPNRVPGSS